MVQTNRSIVLKEHTITSRFEQYLLQKLSFHIIQNLRKAPPIVQLARFQRLIRNEILLGYQQNLLQLYRIHNKDHYNQNVSCCGRTMDDNALHGCCSFGASLVPICWLSLLLLFSPLLVHAIAMNS